MDTDKVTLNVGGRRFTTVSATLKLVPGTRLAKLNSQNPAYDATKQEYFFDRNPDMFGPILDYYRSGELHYSHCVCGPSIKKELKYWGIDENCISTCCWKAYKEAEEQKRTLKQLAKTLTPDDMTISKENRRFIPCCPGGSNEEAGKSWFTGLRQRLWTIMDHPFSSRSAKAWATLTFFLIIISITVVMMETHPLFRVERNLEEDPSVQNYTNIKRQMFRETELHPVLYYMDAICTLAFFVELILRVMCTPSRKLFFKSAFNIIDIFCVVPMVAVLLLQWSTPGVWDNSHFYLIISYISLASVLRVFRLFKLARHYRGFKILSLTVKSSLKELFLLFTLISTGMITFSTLVYYAEFNERNKFDSIPTALWWSIITMTTVGYGDISPTSGWGYVVGAICAISGTLITGLPIPIIASNFNYYYSYSRLMVKMAERIDKSGLWKGNNRMKRTNTRSSRRSSQPRPNQSSDSMSCTRHTQRVGIDQYMSNPDITRVIPSVQVIQPEDVSLPGMPIELVIPELSHLHTSRVDSVDSAFPSSVSTSIGDYGIPSPRTPDYVRYAGDSARRGSLSRSVSDLHHSDPKI